jgi:hypothetical protein
MVKQSLALMSLIFARERFGAPQIFAGVLLVMFIAECAWLVAHEYGAMGTTEHEFVRIEEGLEQWSGHGVAGTPFVKNPLEFSPTDANESYDGYHSPLWYLIAAAPLAAFHVAPESPAWISLARAPYIMFGALLGASLWYVSRRLYGNAGGYIALGLYCFSPAVIRSSVLWAADANIGGVAGTFGAVFTAIAVSHTLYAPREVVLWNWRRTLLLGVSLALAIGSHFTLAVIVPVLLGFMLYVAPRRKLAATIIFISASTVAALLLFASYFFHPRIFIFGLAHGRGLDGSWHSAAMPGAYTQVAQELVAGGPVLVLLIPVAVAVYLGWGRTRYFGNTAPLIMAVLFLGLRVFSPHSSGSIFGLATVVFFFVFAAGIAADLLETKARQPVLAVIVGLVGANALWDLMALAHIGR